jgi:hypothetical protein
MIDTREPVITEALAVIDVGQLTLRVTAPASAKK